MSVNDECSSWYACNRVGDFCCQVWDRRKEVCMVIDHRVRSFRPTLLQMLMALRALVVDCE